MGGKVLLIAYAVDISATGGATMRNNEAIINESRLTVVRECTSVRGREVSTNFS